MITVVGVFKTRYAAERGIDRMMMLGVTRERISILTPESTDREIASIPTSDTEQPGMGRTMGEVVGGAMGVAGGLSAGAALASLLVPGVGPILAGGLLGGGLLGIGGAKGGAAIGTAIEDSATGVPRDEMYVYEDALRQGRTLVVGEAEDERQAEAVRFALEESGAESIDAAREDWWIGLRSSEQEIYDGDFDQDEPYYRKGFEAAHSPVNRGKSYDQALPYLTKQNAIAVAHPAFRRGYERGSQHAEQVRRRVTRN